MAGEGEIGLDEGETAEAQISGKDLVGLFSGAGGFIPPVVFLSACHSGSLVTARDWASERADWNRLVSLSIRIGRQNGAPARTFQ